MERTNSPKQKRCGHRIYSSAVLSARHWFENSFAIIVHHRPPVYRRPIEQMLRYAAGMRGWNIGVIPEMRGVTIVGWHTNLGRIPEWRLGPEGSRTGMVL